MAKNKMKFGFKGFEEVFEKLDRLNADMKKITEEALEKSFEAVTPGIQAAIEPHHDSGQTEKSLVTTPEIKWDGTRGNVKVGFNIENGGLPSVFLMYGTPRHTAANQYGKSGKTVSGVPQDTTLYNAIYGTTTKNKVKKIQKEIFEKALKEAMR